MKSTHCMWDCTERELKFYFNVLKITVKHHLHNSKLFESSPGNKLKETNSMYHLTSCHWDCKNSEKRPSKSIYSVLFVYFNYRQKE